MAKRKKYRNKRHNTTSTILFLLAIIAGLTGWNGCSETTVAHETENPEVPTPNPGKPDDGETSKHYPGLETVNIPEAYASQIKEYVGFTISFNKDNGTPNYVAWELLGDEVKKDVERSDNFWTDPDIEGCPTYKDYTRSGYDRGHMCPAADQKWSQEAMNDCFVMANICPQDHSLNAGAWNTLENKERQWAQRDSAIMIIAGPLYDVADTKRIGNAGVRVPGAFFKVLMAPYLDEPRGIAFVYPNMTAPGNMQDYAMSIDDLEEILGYDFFPALPDEIENKVEKSYSFKEWNRSK